MRVLFLNPPSYSRYDSAGARFQATRVTQSLWYPAWLGYATVIVPKSKLIDAPADNLGINQLAKIIKDYDVVILYSSTPSLENDFRVATFIKKEFPDKKIIFVGPHVSVLDIETLNKCRSIDAVIRREFDYPSLEISQNRPWSQIKGLTYRKGKQIIKNEEREIVKDLDKIPFVSKIYKRDLKINSYHLPFALYPYISIYAGRGCPNRCTFCLWPQTFTGHLYRKRTVDNVIQEIIYIKKNLPQIKEIFFDDDTFTIDKKWVIEFCNKVAPLLVTWSCNARADLDFSLLRKMKKAGCRVLVVGYESADDQILFNIKKGVTVKKLIAFTKNAHRANLLIHGTFVLGLPGETKETMKRTLEFAKNLNLETLQVSVATPLPGTEFFKYCQEKGYLKETNLITNGGYQNMVVSYPNLQASEIKEFNDKFLKTYYFRLSYILLMLKLMIKKPEEFPRILRNSFYFFRYLLTKKE